jgi:hypothetical protein
VLEPCLLLCPCLPLAPSSLSAVRDSTILPHTQDLDVAVTPFLIQFLELNSTREELWRHGYAVFLGEGSTFWKFHAHIHHPKPEFRNAFRVMDEYYGDWEARTKQAMAVYMVRSTSATSM